MKQIEQVKMYEKKKKKKIKTIQQQEWNVLMKQLEQLIDSLRFIKTY